MRLYVAGASPKSLHAFSNLKALCEQHLAGRYDIEVIDLMEDPSRAETDGVIAVPTLVRHSPWPSRRVVGDLSNTEQVIVGLGLEIELHR